MIKKHIPNTITCCNLICGCMATGAAFHQHYVWALLMIVAGAVFDFFDGMVARLLGVSSPIGKELDSLADVVTFGVAPSAIIFGLFCEVQCPEVLMPLRSYLPYTAFLMAAFSALRLAKFNLDTRQTTSFIGLPTPANALFWASLTVGQHAFLVSPKFNAVFCMAHMFRHSLEGGIGMRQMMDYYYVLKNLAPEDKKPVMKTLKRLGMRRFTASVMTSMWFNFGLDDEYLLCPVDIKHGKKLVNDIIAVGNFGVMDKRNYASDGESKWARFMRKNRRVFSNLRYYPREVIWSPFARVSQFVWRKFKGYL